MKKRFALTLFTLTLFSFCSFAYATDSADNFASQMAERLKSQLSLSDEQTSQIQSIFENYKPTRETESEAETRMGNIQNEISSILTDEQKKLHAEQMGSGHFGQRKEWGFAQGESGRRGQLTEEERKAMNAKWESLTDEQKAEMKAQREQMKEQRRGPGASMNPMTTEEQRKLMSEKWESLTDEQKAQMKAQREQMQEHRGSGFPRSGMAPMTDEQRQEFRDKRENFFNNLTDEQKAEFKARHDQMRKSHDNRPGGPWGKKD